MKHQNYGRPSTKTINARIKGWNIWRNSMTTLRSIHSEIAEKRQALIQAQSLIEDCDKLEA